MKPVTVTVTVMVTIMKTNNNGDSYCKDDEQENTGVTSAAVEVGGH